jgi:predicted enzyme related to lactoylglutathione lyase
MPNPLAHFDIAVADVRQARRFYESVFGWTIEDWGPPDFCIVNTGEPGKAHGSISKRHGPPEGTRSHGWECTISVQDLEAIRAAVVANGGKVLGEPEEIVGVGTLFRFADPDGNVACAMKYVRQPQP